MGTPPAFSLSVTACTTRVPSAQRSTRSTRTPGSPNAMSYRQTLALGSLRQPECFATFRLRKTRGSRAISALPSALFIATGGARIAVDDDAGLGAR